MQTTTALSGNLDLLTRYKECSASRKQALTAIRLGARDRICERCEVAAFVGLLRLLQRIQAFAAREANTQSIPLNTFPCNARPCLICLVILPLALLPGP